MDILNCTPQSWIENEMNFIKELENDIVWNSIPLLNVNELSHLKDSTLVRFEGMIQDMHSPEYYMEKFEVFNEKTKIRSIKDGKYCDAAFTSNHEVVNLDSEFNVTSERQTFVVTSIPGENDWVQELTEKKIKISQIQTDSLNSKTKRTFNELMCTEETEEGTGPSSTCSKNQKKVCPESKIDQFQIPQSILSKDHMLNFPLPHQNGKKCHLKMYRDQDGLKLNDVCEFVGFLDIDPITEAAYQQDSEYESKMEIETLHPPSSLVPKIHCVKYKKLKHNNPLLRNDNDLLSIDKFKMIHDELLIVFTQLLLGDQLAAEYLIFSLLSEIYMRADFLPLGKFCLNISNIPKMDKLDYASELYKFIEKLTSKSYYLPMTLENMNTLSFIPKKDYECNRLTSGILQLSQNTHVVLDETKLSPGKLNTSGINNVKALTEVIQYQKLTYNFKYYQLDFDCDIPFLILSEGKSLLCSDVHVVMDPDQNCIDTFAEIIEAANHFLKPELLEDIRKYLTQAKLIKYEISSNIEEFIQQEFVDMRQNENFTADDLHGLLVLARLTTIADGKTCIDKESWKKACEMEKTRKSRIVK